MNKLRQVSIGILKNDLLVPVLILSVYIVFFLVARKTIPSGEELIQLFTTFYNQFGYQIIFISAFLESLLLVNFLIPGSIGMAMGAVFAKTGDLNIFLVVILASTAAIIGYSIDFFLGKSSLYSLLKTTKFGEQLNTSKKYLTPKNLFLAFINPTVASFVSITAGAAKISYKEFFITSVVATFWWFSLWGALFYFLGEVIVNILIKYFFIVVLIGWIGYFLLSFRKAPVLKTGDE